MGLNIPRIPILVVPTFLDDASQVVHFLINMAMNAVIVGYYV